MLAIPPPLQHAFEAVLHSDLAADAAAAAGLASALTSLVKRSVRLAKAAVALKVQSSAAAAAATRSVAQARAAEAAACFPAAAIVLVNEHLSDLGSVLNKALQRSLGSACSGSLSSQAAASAAMLVVVLARSLVQLAGAMEAAGPQLLFDSLQRRPQYLMIWLQWSGKGPVYLSRSVHPVGEEQQHTVERQWRCWQSSFLVALQPLLACLRELGMAPSAAAALQEAQEEAEALRPQAGACTATALPASERAATDQGSTGGPTACADGSSCSSGQQVKWGYLLHLQQCSPRWAAAAAAFDAKWQKNGMLPATVAAQQFTQLYQDAVCLCRALVDAAPITVVCNNPGCESLADVSEAAASCKACPGCKCRYCSAACYKADWKRHKHACRQLAAAGFACCS
jgi:hypothetical protein